MPTKNKERGNNWKEKGCNKKKTWKKMERKRLQQKKWSHNHEK